MELGKVRVSGISAETVCRKKIPRGIVGATVGLEFTDPLWDNLTKIAVFWGSCVRTVRNPDPIVEIPWEVVADAGFQLRMGVHGVDEENNLVIPTIWAELGTVEYAADPAGDPAMDPQLPIWTELQEQIDALADCGMSAEERILILSLFKNAAYTADMSATIAQLETLWSGGDIPDIPDVPDVPDVPTGGATATDDGNGNITVTGATATDDGNGNVTVVGMTAIDDGNGNITVS